MNPELELLFLVEYIYQYFEIRIPSIIKLVTGHLEEIEIPVERLEILGINDYFTGMTERIEYWNKKRLEILYS